MVGPESAGADPGPACYGRGTQPTVTDANLVLGRFGGAGLLGGEFKLDEARARDALSELAQRMSAAARRKVSITQAALGVVRVVNTNMERALRVISVERGYDPRGFSLLPFGGAGGLHAVALARALSIPRVIAPKSAGALSALGALGRPLCVGVSRKSFIGAITGRAGAGERLAGSLAATAVAVWNGAALLRTHDVADTLDAVRVAERLRNAPRAL